MMLFHKCFASVNLVVIVISESGPKQWSQVEQLNLFIMLDRLNVIFNGELRIRIGSQNIHHLLSIDTQDR
jgi:hypothetical protein